MALLMPVADQEGETLARSALDQHWAVAAIPPERRALLLERVSGSRPNEGDGLGEPIAESLTMLATAYELAALGQLDAILHEPGGEVRRLARDVLTLGAARAYRIYQAVRLPEGDQELAVRATLRLAALAVVGRQRESFERWAARPSVERLLDGARSRVRLDGWDASDEGTRLAVWLTWLSLLRRPDREALRGSVEALGVLREHREAQAGDAADPREPASMLRLRFQNFVLRQVAEGAEQLASAMHRRVLPDATAKLSLHFGAARSAATGDHGLDLLLAWMHGAAVTVAGGVTDQLELPGM